MAEGGRVVVLILYLCVTMNPPRAFAQNTAAINGIVVRMGTGDPLPQSTVELVATETPTRATYTATTAENGTFSIADIAQGTYRLIARRGDGYLPAEYGQRSSTTAGLPITLTTGQRMSDIRLAMWPTGSISGRVFHSDGEPVGRAQVQALRRSFAFEQSSILAVTASVLTNDLGEYRLFWLSPGDYFISAIPVDPTRRTAQVVVNPPGSETASVWGSTPAITRRVLPDGKIQEETNLTVYFPGVLDASNASPIHLRPGESLRGTDMILPSSVPTRRVRGIILNASTGQPAADAGIILATEASTAHVNIFETAADARGLFEIAGVIAGRYSLVATIEDDDTMTGLAQVEVGERDIENVVVAAGSGFNIPVEVILERPTADRGFLGIRLVREPQIVGIPPSPADDSRRNLTSPGEFALDRVGPGDYRIDVQYTPTASNDASHEAYVKSIRLAGTDVMNDGLHITGQPEGAMEIIVGSSPGSIKGVVVDGRQEALANVIVALVPDAPNRRRSDLYTSISTDSSGQFTLRAVPPGNYTLFAWEDVPHLAWRNEDFIRMYESRGRAVQIGEGSTLSVQLVAIPAEP